VSIDFNDDKVRDEVGLKVYHLMMSHLENSQFLSETDAAKEAGLVLNIGHQAAKRLWNKWKIENLDNYKLLKSKMMAQKQNQ